jgi:hypothetical protein
MDGVYYWNCISDGNSIIEQETLMQWFEYDKAEEMLEALERNLAELEKDIESYGEKLSRTSLIAMKNEVGRLTHHAKDVREVLGEEES